MTTFTRKDNAFKIKETPDSAAADFEVGTDGAVTIAELKLPVAAVAATGSVQGDAAALSFGINTVTAADAAKGVVLPTAVAGAIVIVKNVDNAVLKIYPASGGTINVLSADAAISAAARTCPMFIATSATQWYTMPLLPS
jgi:hypothetical protein